VKPDESATIFSVPLPLMQPLMTCAEACEFRLTELEERHLLGFIRAKTEEAERPLKASTLLNILSVLRRVMALAVEDG
jgi:hypothetical protein